MVIINSTFGLADSNISDFHQKRTGKHIFLVASLVNTGQIAIAFSSFFVTDSQTHTRADTHARFIVCPMVLIQWQIIS